MKKITVGIEDFKELIDKDYLYIDKSYLISDLLDEKVVLYTRPRRFGKTINMSMLYYYFSIKQHDNAYLFNNLLINKIIKAKDHQNKYPVIFITLKDMKRSNYSEQVEKFASIISNIVDDNIELLNSLYLNERQKILLKQYLNANSSSSNLQDALLNISICLEKHYHQKVIILIDEYDVPLQEAYLNGYYDEMTSFLKNVFSAALKTNSALEKGVLTGCLRIAKESIFTGLNNFIVRSILDQVSATCFGFTNDEVENILSDYNLKENYNDLRNWYDGYIFGEQEIYNPWSTLMYINKLVMTSKSEGESFWANTSGNDIVHKYISNSNYQLKEEFDILIKGEEIDKEIKPELTYREMDNIDNIYSFLLFTGYLKVTEQIKTNWYKLKLPNQEIKYIYTNIFDEWFRIQQKNVSKFLYEALLNEDEDKANEILNELLFKLISYYDFKESFYHGVLLGIFSTYNISSNKEAGLGRYDLAILPEYKKKRAVLLEFKVCHHEKELDLMAQVACKQILDNKYIEGLNEQRYSDVIAYGIAFYKKECVILKVKQ